MQRGSLICRRTYLEILFITWSQVEKVDSFFVALSWVIWNKFHSFDLFSRDEKKRRNVETVVVAWDSSSPKWKWKMENIQNKTQIVSWAVGRQHSVQWKADTSSCHFRRLAQSGQQQSNGSMSANMGSVCCLPLQLFGTFPTLSLAAAESPVLAEKLCMIRGWTTVAVMAAGKQSSSLTSKDRVSQCPF